MRKIMSQTEKQEINGLLYCVASKEDLFNKVNQIYVETNGMSKYLSHLSKLDVLEDIKLHLMDAATGKDQLQTKTAMVIFKILGGVIFGFLATFVYLLTAGHVTIPGLGH